MHGKSYCPGFLSLIATALVESNSVKQDVRMLLRVLDQDLINLLIDIIGLFDLSGQSARLFQSHTDAGLTAAANSSID
jgi:hypothetical protein